MKGRTSGIRHILLLLIVVALVAGLSGCTSSDEAADVGVMNMAAPDSMDMERAVDVSEEYATEQDTGAGVDAATVSAAERMIVKTAGLRIEVDDVEASVEDVRALAEQHEGQVTDVQISTQEDVPIYRYAAEGSLADGAALSGYITVRVPVGVYDAFITDAQDLGDVLRHTESESDVTQQHIDLSARLANLQAQESQLREFFDSATDVEDLLAIEQELTRVRAEIDSLEAQIAYLERQAAMSTVTIELVGPVPVVRPQGEDWGFLDAITDGVRGAAGVLRFGISFVIATSPMWILAIIAIIVIRVILRRRAKTAPAQQTPSDTV